MSGHADEIRGAERRRSLLIALLVYWVVFGACALTVWRQVSHMPAWRSEVNFNRV